MRLRILALSCGVAAFAAACGSDNNGPDGSIDLTAQQTAALTTALVSNGALGTTAAAFAPFALSQLHSAGSFGGYDAVGVQVNYTISASGVSQRACSPASSAGRGSMRRRRPWTRSLPPRSSPPAARFPRPSRARSTSPARGLVLRPEHRVELPGEQRHVQRHRSRLRQWNDELQLLERRHHRHLQLLDRHDDRLVRLQRQSHQWHRRDHEGTP